MTIAITAPRPTDPNDVPPQGGPSFRTPPHNVQAEKALLGAILLNDRAYERVSDFLSADHFVLQPHANIFGACSKLIERGNMADPVTLQRFFEQDETLAEIGGPAYLAELAASAAPVSNAGEYGRIIYDLHLKRQLITIGEDMVGDAYGGDVEDGAVEQIERAEQHLFNLANTGEYDGGFQSFKDSVQSAIRMAETAHKREGRFTGVATGFVDLDTILGGLHPSDLIILAGRPSMGKTALATNIAFNAADTYHRTGGEEGAVVGFFSLEMSAEQLATRIISEQTHISSHRVRKGELSKAEFDRLVPASNMLHEIPIFIDDSPALTVSALRTRARRLKRKHGLGLIVVDYLQLLSALTTSRNDGRVQEVSEITRGLKTLAKELDVPVLALSQLSRAPEARENKRPQLSDLRESGTIEQDADVVAFIFREEYYRERERPAQRDDQKDDDYFKKVENHRRLLEKVRNIAEVIVAKQRHGPIDTANLQFEGAYTRFSNLEQDHAPQG